MRTNERANAGKRREIPTKTREERTRETERKRGGERGWIEGHDAAGQQNETRDDLLAPSYKAEATAGPIHTRLLYRNKAPPP